MRSYIPYDAESTLEVLHQAIEVTARAVYSPEQIDAWLSSIPSPAVWNSDLCDSLAALVKEDDEGIYAFCNLMHSGEIEYLMCHPRRSRQNAASSMLEALEDIARQKNLPRLTTRASLLAKNVFQRQGFIIDAEEKKLGMTCFRMSKEMD